MLNTVVLVSGGGTNLQAILDGVKNGTITNTKICGVISNKPDAYALTRAEQNGIPGVCVSRKAYETRAEFEDALLAAVDGFNPDLVVLAGFLVILPEKMTPPVKTILQEKTIPPAREMTPQAMAAEIPRPQKTHLP